MVEHNKDFNYSVIKKQRGIGNTLPSKVTRVVAIITITMIFTLSATYVTFLASYQTAQAQTASTNSQLSNIINGNLNSNENNILAQNITNNANNIITSIIGKSGSLGGFRVNATQNQFGAVNNITTSIIGNTMTNVPKMTLSGKIASAQFNLQTGSVEATLFGNWSLNAGSFSNTNLTADFVLRNTSNSNNSNGAATNNNSISGQIQEFHINGLKIDSFQQTNGNNDSIQSLRGTTNLTATGGSQADQTKLVEGIPISITIIQNKMIIINFDSSGQTGNQNSLMNAALLHIFDRLPIIGIVTMTE